MTTLSNEYLEKLKKISAERGIKDFAHTQGATADDLNQLKQKYTGTPQSLLDLLAGLDGMYYRQYGDRKVIREVFGGIIPYYLLSVAQILEGSHCDSIAEIYGEDIVEEMVGPGIDVHQPLTDMLHFADCINNGGSSSLYIDFKPVHGGVKGQIIRFVHDPDEYTVIASDFDAFLQDNLNSGFDFIEEQEEIEEDPELTILVAQLKEGNQKALEQLRVSLNRFHILSVAVQVPTPAVLHVYVGEMRRLYLIRHEIATPSGYTYEPQFNYLLSNFTEQFAPVFQNDAALRKDVADFAREIGDIALMAMTTGNNDMEEIKPILAAAVTKENVSSLYNRLSPEDFYEVAETAWENDVFFECFGAQTHPPRYVQGEARERYSLFSPLWGQRFLSKPQLGLTQFGLLCAIAEDADLERFKTYCECTDGSEVVLRLGFFAQAAVKAGEEAIDKYIDYMITGVLEALQSDSNYFKFCFNEFPQCFDTAVEHFTKNSPIVNDFTFILSLRPEKSVALLKSIEPMLTHPKGRKACAKLLQVLPSS